MFSKRELEGYLLIDHRESPGITPEEAAKAGRGTVPVGRGMKFEAPTVNCSHCRRLVVLNPLRTRDRAYCPKCDHYLCDSCEAARAQTGECYTFAQRIDDFMEDVAKGRIPSIASA